MPYVSGRVVHDASDEVRQRFYCDNFVDLMGSALAAALDGVEHADHIDAVTAGGPADLHSRFP
jgi:hypothetical protein